MPSLLHTIAALALHKQSSSIHAHTILSHWWSQPQPWLRLWSGCPLTTIPRPAIPRSHHMSDLLQKLVTPPLITTTDSYMTYHGGFLPRIYLSCTFVPILFTKASRLTCSILCDFRSLQPQYSVRLY